MVARKTPKTANSHTLKAKKDLRKTNVSRMTSRCLNTNGSRTPRFLVWRNCNGDGLLLGGIGGVQVAGCLILGDVEGLHNFLLTNGKGLELFIVLKRLTNFGFEFA